MNKLENYLTQQPQRGDVTTSTRLLRDIAYERIKDAIQHASLEPGEPLSEVQLSKFLGISRTPIREALQQLTKEGLVEATPGRAVTVASRSLKDVLDILHMRLLLEPEMARLVAESAQAKHIKTIDEAVTRMEQAAQEDDYPTWSKSDSVFHEVMRQVCPNELLGETIVLLRNRVHHLADRDSRHNMARLIACTAEHRAIVTAIADHDGEAAEAAMRNHIVQLRESLFNRLKYS